MTFWSNAHNRAAVKTTWLIACIHIENILPWIFLFVKLEANSLCKVFNLDTSAHIKAASLGYIQYFVEPIKDGRRQLLFHARPNLKGLMERERCFFLLFNEFDDDESLRVEEALLSSQSSFALIGGRVFFIKKNMCATKVSCFKWETCSLATSSLLLARDSLSLANVAMSSI